MEWVARWRLRSRACGSRGARARGSEFRLGDAKGGVLGRRGQVRVRKSSRCCRCLARGEEKHTVRAHWQRTSFRTLEVAGKLDLWMRQIEKPKRETARRPGRFEILLACWGGD